VKQTIATLIGSALLAGCSVIGVRTSTEQPPYQVIGQINEGVELREYGERLAAQVSIDRSSQRMNENSAFSMLAGYIFGNNFTQTKVAMTAPVATKLPSEKIAMTAPVETSAQDEGLYTMRFYLPAGYSLDTAPVPKDTRVELVEVPSETIAAIRFSGLRNQSVVDQNKRVLMKTINESNWKANGDPVAFYYDPPWTAPFLRRNEVAVTVVQQEG
jgi:hypothetical protein